MRMHVSPGKPFSSRTPGYELANVGMGKVYEKWAIMQRR